MRYVRYLHSELEFWGILLSDELIQPMTAAPYAKGVPLGQPVPLGAVRLLPPCQPGKIVAVGKNYQDHIDEFKGQRPANPIIFLIPDTALIGPDEPIILPEPDLSDEVDFEGELALIIGKTASRIKARDYREYVLGYTCSNDVTCRDIQRQDGQWARAKGFDSFLPVGPLLTDEVEPESLIIRTRLNGSIRQESSTDQLIWPVGELLEFITRGMTLRPGDLVLTGTPAGVGRLSGGDTVAVSIEGIGVLQNPVRAAQ